MATTPPGVVTKISVSSLNKAVAYASDDGKFACLVPVDPSVEGIMVQGNSLSFKLFPTDRTIFLNANGFSDDFTGTPLVEKSGNVLSFSNSSSVNGVFSVLRGTPRSVPPGKPFWDLRSDCIFAFRAPTRTRSRPGTPGHSVP